MSVLSVIAGVCRNHTLRQDFFRKRNKTTSKYICPFFTIMFLMNFPAHAESILTGYKTTPARMNRVMRDEICKVYSRSGQSSVNRYKDINHSGYMNSANDNRAYQIYSFMPVI